MSKDSRTTQRPSASPSASPWWRSPMTWVVLFVLLAGGVSVAVAATSRNDKADAEAANQTAFAETTGEILPPFTEPDPAIGMQAPTVSAQTLQGGRVELAGDGTARLYGFFAHWCPHCQAELPTTVDWLKTNRLPDNVEVVAVSTAVDRSGANYPPSAWFAREDWPAVVLLDDIETPLATGFGLTAFPFWVAVDGDGTVIARVSGALTTEQFAGLVAELAEATQTDAQTDANASAHGAGIRLVSAQEGADIQANPPSDLVILDVRTPDEFAEGHLEGATLIDFYEDNFADQLAALDPGVPYLLYCRSGNRSGQTADMMSELGFTDVADVDGGIVEWTEAGHPVVER